MFCVFYRLKAQRSLGLWEMKVMSHSCFFWGEGRTQKKKRCIKKCISKFRAQDETRTHTALRPLPPQSSVYTNFTTCAGTIKKRWAENGTRTRDPNLGKVVLYQLSYFRNCDAKVGIIFESANVLVIFFQNIFTQKCTFSTNQININILNHQNFSHKILLFFKINFI